MTVSLSGVVDQLQDSVEKLRGRVRELEELDLQQRQRIEELDAALEYAARRQSNRENRWTASVIKKRYEEEGKARARKITQ